MKAGQSPCHLSLSPLCLQGHSSCPPSIQSQNWPPNLGTLIPSLSNFKASVSPHHPKNDMQTPSMLHTRPCSCSRPVLENLAQKEEDSLVFAPESLWVLDLEGLNTPEHSLP